MSVSMFLLNAEFRPYAEALVQVARQYRLNPQVTSTYRSIAEQTDLYQKHLRGEHPYPVAPPGQSMHNYGLAFDVVSLDNAWLGEVWRHWGGSWSAADDIHFSV